MKQAIIDIIAERDAVTQSELYVRMQSVHPVDSMTLATAVNELVYVDGELVSRYVQRDDYEQQLLSLPEAN